MTASNGRSASSFINGMTNIKIGRDSRERLMYI